MKKENFEEAKRIIGLIKALNHQFGEFESNVYVAFSCIDEYDFTEEVQTLRRNTIEKMMAIVDARIARYEQEFDSL